MSFIRTTLMALMLLVPAGAAAQLPINNAGTGLQGSGTAVQSSQIFGSQANPQNGLQDVGGQEALQQFTGGNDESADPAESGDTGADFGLLEWAALAAAIAMGGAAYFLGNRQRP